MLLIPSDVSCLQILHIVKRDGTFPVILQGSLVVLVASPYLFLCRTVVAVEARALPPLANPHRGMSVVAVQAGALLVVGLTVGCVRWASEPYRNLELLLCLPSTACSKISYLSDLCH